jgi:hypothetical protein
MFLAASPVTSFAMTVRDKPAQFIWQQVVCTAEQQAADLFSCHCPFLLNHFCQ